MLKYFKEGYTPRPLQEHVLKEMEKYWDHADVFVIQASVGCHAKGQGILMYDGTVKLVEDVVVGDLLMGPDSTPRKVLNLHRGVDSMYTITPKRGEPWTVNKGHILNVHRVRCRQKDNVKRYEHYKENISVEDYLKTTSSYKHNTWQWQASVEFKEKQLPINPYILGIWLGDGTSTRPDLTCGDEEVCDSWLQEADSRNLNVRLSNNGGKAYTFHLSSKHPQTIPNSLLEDLRELNLLGNKHIPHNYKTSSMEQRLKLLAGLIDTDGSRDDGKNSIEITQKSLRLTEDILYVMRSVGMSANIKKKIVNGVTYYRIHASTVNELPPCKVARKCMKKNTTGDNTRCKFRVNYAGVGDYYGFEVDGDNLYIMDNFVVTHNSGKSLLADAISRYALEENGASTTICTPTNILVNQYLEECPHMFQPRARHRGMSERDWGEMKAKMHYADVKVMNYYSYLAHRAYSPVCIFDEAHYLLQMLTDMQAVRLWKHSYHYPDNCRSILELLQWASTISTKDKKVGKLISAITAHPELYTFDIDVEKWRGEERERLKIWPLSPSTSKPILWPPSRVDKIVLMSATISKEDVIDLGLSKKRVKIIDAGSAIPADRRPIRYRPLGNMSYRYQEQNIPKAVELIEDMLEKNIDSKGLVHITYSLSRKLRQTRLGTHPRLIWHGNSNKNRQLKAWKSSPPEEGKVLMACGLTEGLDVKGDLGRWQIILKLPYLNLSDIAVSAKMNIRPQWYQWQCVKDIEQAVGRICRTPTDYGETIIADSAFGRLFRSHRELFSRSFIEALT